MIRPSAKVVSFTSGSKGGVGKSTIVANMAAILDASVTVIDLGFDGNNTVSKLHGVDNDGGILNYLATGANYKAHDSKEHKNVSIIPPGDLSQKYFLLFGSNRHIVAARFEKLVIDLSRNGVKLILIDFPANMEKTIHHTLIAFSDIVNLVMEPSESSIDSLTKLYKEIMGFYDGYGIVNTIVNMIAIDNDPLVDYARKYMNNGETMKIPFDHYARHYTNNGSLAVHYKSGSFRPAITGVTKQIAKQVEQLMGVKL